MGTHFDHGRGRTAGRCLPETFTSPNGERCFVLGADPAMESVALSPDDYTEVRQIVDCTDVDLLVATMDTIGQTPGFYRNPSGWSADPDELWRFDGDPAGATLINRVIPVGQPAGFPLSHVGDVQYGVETYSGNNSVCRVIPIGTTTPTYLRGQHSPVAAPANTLDTYTIQFWVRLDLDAISSSWGWDFPLVQYLDDTGVQNGLRLDMFGLTGAGAHGWYPFLTHYDGGSSSGSAFSFAWVPTTSLPWTQITLVWDRYASPRVLLYLDKTLVDNTYLSTRPRIPDAGGYLQIMHEWSWGAVDLARMLNYAMSAKDVRANYDDAVTLGSLRTTRWRMEIRIGRVVYAARDIVMGERRRWTDFVAPVRRLRGPQEVAVRLTLKEEL